MCHPRTVSQQLQQDWLCTVGVYPECAMGARVLQQLIAIDYPDLPCVHRSSSVLDAECSCTMWEDECSALYSRTARDELLDACAMYYGDTLHVLPTD